MFIDKETKESPTMIEVDEQICAVLNVPVHPKHYGGGYGLECFNWFDTIGFMLSTGKTLEEGEESVLEHYRTDMWKEEFPVIEKIVLFLRQKYTVRSWYSVR